MAHSIRMAASRSEPWCGWRSFSTRYPLVDGQGNLAISTAITGRIFTETRMTAVAQLF
jgi:hypothetical protein